MLLWTKFCDYLNMALKPHIFPNDKMPFYTVTLRLCKIQRVFPPHCDTWLHPGAFRVKSQSVLQISVFISLLTTHTVTSAFRSKQQEQVICLVPSLLSWTTTSNPGHSVYKCYTQSCSPFNVTQWCLSKHAMAMSHLLSTKVRFQILQRSAHPPWDFRIESIMCSLVNSVDSANTIYIELAG